MVLEEDAYDSEKQVDEEKDQESIGLTNEYDEEVVLNNAYQPFGTFFKIKLNEVKITTVGAGTSANKFYQLKFFEYVEKKWLPTSFWSALLLGMIKLTYTFHVLQI